MVIVRRSRSPRLRRHVENEASHRSNVNNVQNPDGISRSESEIVTGGCHDAMQSSAEVKCPLCRGSVSGWIPAGEVRQYLDEKLRTCSHDSCRFAGTYEQLREHARTAHFTKPAHVDLSRKRTWDRLEREQEVGDVISAIRSQIPGAIIVGDYVIETRDDMSPDIDSDDESSEGWWSSVRGDAESPDDRLDSPSVWPNNTLGSPSIWPDERHNLPRLLPQNNIVSPRLSFNNRRSLHSDWQGIRQPRTQSLLRRGISNHHSGNRSNYRGYRRMLPDRSYAGTRDPGRRIDPSLVPSRRQRLRYTHRSHY